MSGLRIQLEGLFSLRCLSWLSSSHSINLSLVFWSKGFLGQQDLSELRHGLQLENWEELSANNMSIQAHFLKLNPCFPVSSLFLYMILKIPVTCWLLSPQFFYFCRHHFLILCLVLLTFLHSQVSAFPGLYITCPNFLVFMYWLFTFVPCDYPWLFSFFFFF